MAKNPVDSLIDKLTEVSDGDFNSKFVIDYFKGLAIISAIFFLWIDMFFMMGKQETEFFSYIYGFSSLFLFILSFFLLTMQLTLGKKWVLRFFYVKGKIVSVVVAIIASLTMMPIIVFLKH